RGCRTRAGRAHGCESGRQRHRAAGRRRCRGAERMRLDRSRPRRHRIAAAARRRTHHQGGDRMSLSSDPMILLWTLVKILIIAVPLIICVAMYVWWERKVIGWMHVRIGPNKIGPFGLLQAFADVVKLLVKEIIIPTNANRF